MYKCTHNVLQSDGQMMRMAMMSTKSQNRNLCNQKWVLMKGPNIHELNQFMNARCERMSEELLSKLFSG